MPSVLPVPVTPAVLAWARQESGYPVDRVAQRLQVKAERVAAWEQGARPPTMRQVQELARFYHRPLSVLLLASPPQLSPLAAEYRRLPGVVPGRETPELRQALRQMISRRENMLNLLGELSEQVPEFRLQARLDEKPEAVGRRLREALKVEVATQFDWPNEWRAWHAWRASVEGLGALVFQFSKVTLTEARGLSLLRFPLPVAAVNNKEQPGPKSYTLLHEVVHLMLTVGREEEPALKERRHGDEWTAVERFAEEVASHALVPEDALVAEIRSGGLPGNGWDIGDVRQLAKQFRVSPLAMATRLRASGFMDWSRYNAWKRGWDSYVATLKPRSRGFAHPVDLALSRNGRPFVQLVLEALGSNRITAVDAARYIDLKYEHFEKLRDTMIVGPGRGAVDE